tara:strand:- start:411 stop:1262 length:852 start_codon:yes stop_codon:yes gene_type:complete
MKKLTLKLKRKIKKGAELAYKIPFFKKPLPRNPFGNKPWANEETYLRLHRDVIKLEDSSVRKFEKELGYSISTEWINDLALHTQVVIKDEPLNFFHGRVLYSVLSDYINQFKKESLTPLIILETGTARGFSSLCMSRAIIDANYPGIITTIDCIPHNERIFWNCIDDKDGKKTRYELLSKWEEELSRIIFVQGWTKYNLNSLGLNRINFAFLDAQHTKEDVLSEFEYINNRQTKGDLIVFDDVTPNVFDGVCQAVAHIENNYPYIVKNINFKEDRGYAIAKRI